MVSQVIFLSYCDKLTMSLNTSRSVVENPELLCALFVREVRAWAKQEEEEEEEEEGEEEGE